MSTKKKEKTILISLARICKFDKLDFNVEIFLLSDFCFNFNLIELQDK